MTTTLRQLRRMIQFPALSLKPSQLIQTVVLDVWHVVGEGAVLNVNGWARESRQGRPCEVCIAGALLYSGRLAAVCQPAWPPLWEQQLYPELHNTSELPRPVMGLMLAVNQLRYSQVTEFLHLLSWVSELPERPPSWTGFDKDRMLSLIFRDDSPLHPLCVKDRAYQGVISKDEVGSMCDRFLSTARALAEMGL